MRSLALLTGFLVFFAACARHEAQGPKKGAPLAAPTFQQKWIYIGISPERPDAAIEMLERGKAIGVTHILSSDSGHLRLSQMSPEALANAKMIREKADSLGIKIIPAVFPTGYGGRYFGFDRSLAAGLPVKGAPFLVKDGLATPDPADVPAVANADFEEAEGDSLSGWTRQDYPGERSFVDKEVKHSGDASLRITNLDSFGEGVEKNVRLGQILKVKPFQRYMLSVWVKAENLVADEEAYVYMTSSEGKRRNTYMNLRIRGTQDWTRHFAEFNTLEAEEIDFSIGASDASAGTVWFDELTIEPGGLESVIRRDACPLTVTNADGSVVYTEGKDYVLESAPEPASPSPERRPGGAARPEGAAQPEGAPQPRERRFRTETRREPPPLVIPEGSSIKDGETILVSFFHPTRIYNDQVNLSITDPKVFELMDMEMKNAAELWQASGYMMNVDEIRVGGWEPQPEGKNLTPGMQLAEYTRKAVAIVKKHAPDADIYVWSDMYTPFHNARPFSQRGYYYLVNGNWDGAWEGLPAEVIIINWYSPVPEAPRWFYSRGHKQVIAGYYDGTDTAAMQDNIRNWMEVSEGVPGMMGIMYTTWRRNYDNLEEYFRLVDEYPAWVKEAETGEALSEK